MVKYPDQSRAGRLARSGFTLLETLLVLGLISMLAAVLIGGSASLLKGTARDDPESALMALLQTVRRQAVEQAKVIELKPDIEADGEDAILTYAWHNQKETLPVSGDTRVKIIAPEVKEAILLGGQVEERALTRIRFYPDGTCDRMRVEIIRNQARRVIPIDPLTCAPLPAEDAK
ncbi:MAG: prepilin-type N-terminal cleavage/methylation domain-containing protein [Verrucomicrobia bacterium]|nr:prepilin-type N-terminal cleavage/methylation domain-containing protein [Verrucomicrobiota bacterium]